MVDGASGSVSRVVKETLEPEPPENAKEGMPSLAASQAAPLIIIIFIEFTR